MAQPEPYARDGATLHLWHLDEPVAPALDSVSTGLILSELTNGATLRAPAFSGFGTALSTADGGVAGGNSATAIDAYAAPATLVNAGDDNVDWSFDDPATGAFTFEALVRIDFDPLANLGAVTNGGTGRNLPMQILSGEQDGNGGGVRSWQLRLDPVGFNPNVDGFTAALAQPAIEFINVNNGSSVQHLITLLPTNGVDAVASNQWYHLAVAYDGNDDTPSNLQVFWTLLDTNRTEAALLAARQMTQNLNDSGAVDLCIGNTGRTTPNNNFIGLIDEVRISSTARVANEFVFRSVSVQAASAIPEPWNPPEATLDGDLGTRWSAQGDGQWITYDLGRPETVESLEIAFYSGNTRTATLDVLLSIDDVNWFTALSGAVSSGTTPDLEFFDLPDDLPARYVRIVGHGNSQSDWNSLTEAVIHRSAIVDTDRDGLPDPWEQFYFQDLDEIDTGDPDDDTLSNFYEYVHTLSPTQPNGSDDSDGDDLPDAWERTWFGNLNETADGDPDRDTVNNYDEWDNGCDPTNANSVPGDTDGDSMADAWELANLGGMAYWAYEDPDADGYHNVAERVAGTSPTNSASHPDWISPRVAFLRDSIVTSNACLMPVGATYGRAINGVSFQNQPLLFNGHQYIAWYDTAGADQSLWLGRRAVNGVSVGPWEMFDTGSNFTNGDENSWDAHNVIALGICHADGTLHFSWDHHGHTLRYRRSVPGLCTTNLAAWGPGAFSAEQNWLVAAGQTIFSVTYPRFIHTPTGGLRFIYRTGSTSAGDQWLHAYLPATSNWTVGRKFSAKEGTFTGYSLNGGTFTSSSRNAYENGYDFGLDGTLHYTWTYREATANPCNHDIQYANSTDDGVTWRNNAGTQIADTSVGEAIRVDSPGVIVEVISMRQRLINQQAQCVDNDGRVHVLMLHRRIEPGFEWVLGDSAFSTEDTAYYHYFRDPATGEWSQRRLPVDHAVGSRPKIGFDASGNVYAVYIADYNQVVVPGYSSGKLVVAGASKASLYTDWEVVQVIEMGLDGEPLLDQARLLADNILSVFIQETSATTSVVGTPLHLFDFAVGVVEPDAAALNLSLNFSGQDVLLVMPAQSGHAYQLRAASTLSPPDWSNVGAAVHGLDGLLALPDPNGRSTEQRFYRVFRDP